jgi:hypothetical protein
MNIRALPVLPALAAALLAGCASSGYSPPAERRGADRCPAGEVWVCEDRYPSRIESESERDAFCRCENLIR